MTEPALSPNSPLPWSAHAYYVHDDGGRFVAKCFSPVLSAEIITAVNAHATLTAERDEARARADCFQRERAELSDKLNGTPCAEIRWEQERAGYQQQLFHAESARDAALAEVARLSSEVARVAAALERAPIPHDYNEKHGFDIQRFIFDFTTWRVIARAALAPKGAPDV